MELTENYCLICKKYTSVLSNRDSNLYFRLLHKYLYSENLSDLEFKKIYIEKQLCTQCAYNIDTVSTFINNIITKDFHSSISNVECNFCHEEYDCIYTYKDITEDFHQIILLFLRKVLKIIEYDQSWQICLRCSFSITTWNNIKEFIQNDNKNNKERSKSVEDMTSDKNLNEKGNNSDENIYDLTLPTIIKNKFNNIVEKTQLQSNKKRCLNEQLTNVKTVSDITLNNYELLTEVIASNKQLMIEKPYVKLKKLNIKNYSCKDCHKTFSSNSSALFHEFNHYLRLTSKKQQNTTKNIDVNQKSPNTSGKVNNIKKGYVSIDLTNKKQQNTTKNIDVNQKSPNTSGKVNKIKKGYVSIDLTNKKQKNTIVTPQNSSSDLENICDLANICEIVYSDDETTNKSNDVIVIDSDDEDCFTVPNGTNNYTYFKSNSLFNNINDNYQSMFNTFVSNQRRFTSVQNKTPMLISMLEKNIDGQSSGSGVKNTQIRVRNDLY